MKQVRPGTPSIFKFLNIYQSRQTFRNEESNTRQLERRVKYALSSQYTAAQTWSDHFVAVTCRG
jgi:hypothetical protein